MKILQCRKAATPVWVVVTAASVLLTSAALNAQEKKKETQAAPPPAHAAPAAPAHVNPPAQVQQHVPQHQPPAQGQAPAQTQHVPQRQNPNYQPNTGQPQHQNPTYTGQPRTNTNPTYQPNNGQPRTNTNPTYQPNQGQPNQNPRFNPNAGGGRPNEGYGRPNNPPNNNLPNNRGYAGGARQPQVVRTPNGGMVRRDYAGNVREVRTPSGAVITHRPDGVRRVEVVRPGNRVVVTTGAGRGYVQHPVMVRNQAFVQRTYYSGGASYTRAYRPYSYAGASYAIYTPVRYYRPGFYAYAYNPWARPVVYSWGWGGSPWYGYYGGYFAPYPTYVGPSYWLTDYMFATTLQDAYQEGFAAGGANAQGYAQPYQQQGGQVALTPDVKDAIADEVRRQLDQERNAAQTYSGNPNADLSVAPAWADNSVHTFVVSSAFQVNADGQDCAVTAGDVLQLNGSPLANATSVDVTVLASKGQDCRKGSLVAVQLQDLQEMQNSMRATVDQGLADLQAKQGQGGLPKLPSDANGSPIAPAFAADFRPDSNVATELSQVSQEATQSEQDTVGQAPADPADNTSTAAPQPPQSAGPAVISLGQTIDQVVAILGQPQKVVDLGAKKIYVYRDMKITFNAGKVADVQ